MNKIELVDEQHLTEIKAHIQGTGSENKYKQKVLSFIDSHFCFNIPQNPSS